MLKNIYALHALSDPPVYSFHGIHFRRIQLVFTSIKAERWKFVNCFQLEISKTVKFFHEMLAVAVNKREKMKYVVDAGEIMTLRMTGNDEECENKCKIMKDMGSCAANKDNNRF